MSAYISYADLTSDNGLQAKLQAFMAETLSTRSTFLSAA